MTKICFYKESKEGKLYGFSMEGHACFNTKGPDILCSAISMAGQMTLNGLEEVAHAKVETHMADGLLKVMIQDRDNEKAHILLESLHLAIDVLYQQYPAFMTVSFSYGGE